MSRARHKETKKAEGGRVTPVWNAGGDQNAAKEAEEKKRGGRVHMKADGDEPKMRADHKKRARGGRVGADKNPLSSAAGIEKAAKD